MSFSRLLSQSSFRSLTYHPSKCHSTLSFSMQPLSNSSQPQKAPRKTRIPSLSFNLLLLHDFPHNLPKISDNISILASVISPRSVNSQIPDKDSDLSINQTHNRTSSKDSSNLDSISEESNPTSNQFTQSRQNNSISQPLDQGTNQILQANSLQNPPYRKYLNLDELFSTLR